jgi:hypothetical protein
VAKIKWYGAGIYKAATRSAKGATRKVSADIVKDAKAAAPRGVTGNARRAVAMGDTTVANDLVSTPVGLIGGDGKSFKYVLAIEFGRRKGKKQPPSEELLLWVKRIVKPTFSRKGDTRRARTAIGASLRRAFAKPQPFTGKVKRVSRNEKIGALNDLRQAAKAIGDRRLANLIKGVAFVIARSISKRGIKPRPFLRPAFEKNRRNLLPEFRARFQQAIVEDTK